MLGYFEEQAPTGFRHPGDEMTVAELIVILATLPRELDVQINSLTVRGRCEPLVAVSSSCLGDGTPAVFLSSHLPVKASE